MYEYDKSGNISIKRQFPYSEYAAISTKTLVTSNFGTKVKYSYEGDKLKGYNGVVGITYDYAGNPRKWFKHGANGTECALKLDWKESTLVGITDETTNKKYEYTYNADGLRTGKTVDGVKHEYYLSGSKILAETRETGGRKKLIKYYYDDTGVVGFNLDGADYYFVKSLQGDVEKIYSASGELKAEYSYDSWGKCTIKRSVSGIAEANAFRYRGYYFDSESGLYYLNSRYYDPIIGRFISPDSLDYLDPSAIGGLNLYAYCGNNPIMYVDPDGNFDWGIFWTVIVGCLSVAAIVAGIALSITGVGAGLGAVLIATGIGGITAGVGSAVIQGIFNGWDNIDWGLVSLSGAYGMLIGATIALPIKPLATMGIVGAIGFSRSVSEDLYKSGGDLDSVDWGEAAISGVIDGLFAGAAKYLTSSKIIDKLVNITPSVASAAEASLAAGVTYRATYTSFWVLAMAYGTSYRYIIKGVLSIIKAIIKNIMKKQRSLQ